MMVATEFELLGELEEEREEEAMELELLFPRRPAHGPSSVMRALKSGSVEYELLDFPEFENAAGIAQKKLLDFREKFHLRPQDYRKLILTARLHPFPGRSTVIIGYPVPNYNLGLLTLVLDGFLQSTEPGESTQEVWAQILGELYRLADRKFAREIAAENKLVAEAAEIIRIHKNELKPVLLEAAMFDPQTLKMKPEELSKDFHKLGLRLVGEVGLQSILDSEVNEAHLTRLGYRFAEYANTLQKKDRAFNKEVDQERRRRQQLKQEQKRKQRPSKRT